MMRLLADAMLGSLARWLRILGYDTAYHAAGTDNELVRRARAEGRVVLTRDTGLARRRNLRVLLVRSERMEEQLCQVLHELNLPAPAPFSRCPVCNEVLEPLPRDEAWGLVPPYVFVSHEEFRLCPACNQAYWRGTHWENMARTLAGLCRPAET